jgi:hypothetical protein
MVGRERKVKLEGSSLASSRSRAANSQAYKPAKFANRNIGNTLLGSQALN